MFIVRASVVEVILTPVSIASIHSFKTWTLCALALLLLTAISCGIASSIASVSPRKGKLKLIATVLFGSAFSFLALAMFAIDRKLPTYQASGKIETAVVHTQGRDYRTDVRIRTTDGAHVSVYASGRSNFFRPGEQVDITYQGYTGRVTKAIFFAPDGSQEGIFDGSGVLWLCVMFGAGIFLVWCGLKVYNRDPEGSERSFR